jgi:hypothetical protein
VRRYCQLKHVIEGKIEVRTAVAEIEEDVNSFGMTLRKKEGTGK